MKYVIAYGLAVLLHLAVLFGVAVTESRAPPPAPEKKYIEVTLIAQPPSLEILPPPMPAIEDIPPPLPETKPPPPPPPPEPPLIPPPTVEAPLPELKPEPPPSQPQPLTTEAMPSPASLSVSATPPTSQPNASLVAPPLEKIVPVSRVYFKNRVEPEYPSQARRQHQQGSVTLEVFVNEFGHVDKVVVAKSSGYSLLDNAAVEAIKQSSFNPTYLNKTPMPSHAQITYFFRLE